MVRLPCCPRITAAATRPRAIPTPAPPTTWTTPNVTQSRAPGSPRHASITPMVSSAATGSLSPDSAPRMRAGRSGTGALRSEANTAAASVDATTAPTRRAVVVSTSKARWTTAATTAPVTSTPTVESASAGPTAPRRSSRRVRRPPSKRMRVRAATAMPWASPVASNRIQASPSSLTSIPSPRRSRPPGTFSRSARPEPARPRSRRAPTASTTTSTARLISIGRVSRGRALREDRDAWSASGLRARRRPGCAILGCPSSPETPWPTAVRSASSPRSPSPSPSCPAAAVTTMRVAPPPRRPMRRPPRLRRRPTRSPRTTATPRPTPTTATPARSTTRLTAGSAAPTSTTTRAGTSTSP